MSAFAASRAPQVLNENSETSEDIDGSIADLTPENNDEERYSTKSAHFMDISLSTWSPTNENVWMITERAVGIRMKQGETATFIGQYEIKVRKGMVSIYGAWLTVDGLTQRVFAPSTHALPPIACMSQEAEIVLMSCRRTMRHLSRVSPLYRNIWNQSWGQADAPKLASALRMRSFEFVSAVCQGRHAMLSCKAAILQPRQRAEISLPPENRPCLDAGTRINREICESRSSQDYGLRSQGYWKINFR